MCSSLVGILTLTVGLTLPILTYMNAQTSQQTPTKVVVIDLNEKTAEEVLLDSAAEISFERIFDGCEHCPDRQMSMAHVKWESGGGVSKQPAGKSVEELEKFVEGIYQRG